jgi:predicted transposase YbfD/YdcC
MKHLLSILKRIPDPRQAWKVKHNLAEILLISIIAVTANANSSHQIHTFAVIHEPWLRRILPLKNGIPSRLTFERVLRILNPKHFQIAFMQIMQFLQKASEGSVVAIDGKAYHHAANSSVLYAVNAWCAHNGMTLGYVPTQEKSNEITAIPELLRCLDIKGATVTIDAIGCQRKIVAQIVSKNKADYAIALKRNHPTMYEEFSLYAEHCLSQPGLYQYHRTHEKGHGRIEKREYYLFDDLAWFPDLKKWKNLRAFLMVKSTREVIGKEPSTETRFFITSLTGVKQAAVAVRTHWGIENSLHWVLDVVFKEDDWKSKNATSATNLAAIRRFTYNILKAHPADYTTPTKRYICSLNIDFLKDVLFNPSLFS